MRGDICKVESCRKIIISKHGRACGSCKAKKGRYGSYSGEFKPKSIEDKFWPNVNKTKTCWLWVGYVEPAGYGKMRVGSKNMRAHRVSWELHNKPIPVGLCILHKCDIRNCVNPEHLFLGTHKDNMVDCVNKGRNACNPLKGEASPASKLKEADVREVKALLSSGESIASISRKYGVSTLPIFKIKHNKTWKHIK